MKQAPLNNFTLFEAEVNYIEESEDMFEIDRFDINRSTTFKSLILSNDDITTEF